MHNVPQQRDHSRRQYDIPAMRPPQTISPELDEILHMLKAIDAPETADKSNN